MKQSKLIEIRQSIDLLDEEIVKLISQRFELVKEAALTKKDEISVRDDKRVESVITKVRGIACTYQMDEQIIESVYRTMISEFIDFELKEYKKQIPTSVD